VPELKILESKFKDHCEANSKEFNNLALSMKNLKRELSHIRENHLEHIKSAITDLKVQVSDNRKDIKWLAKIQWAVVTGLAGNLIGVIYLIMNKTF
jgi:CII-binding regulator of phage lambda lysogenization HflD